MPNFSPNDFRTRLHSGDVPDGPLTPRLRRLVDAVRGCWGLSDITVAPRETTTSVQVARVPYGTSDAAAARIVADGIAEARRTIDRLQGVLDCYGGGAFAPAPEGLPAGAVRGETRHDLIVSAMREARRRGCVITRLGDTRVQVGPDGAYDLADAPA